MNRKNFPWQKLSNKMRKHFSGRVLANVQAALLSETQTVVPDVRSRSNVRQDVRAAYTTTVVCALPPVGPSTGTGDASVGLRTSGVSHLCVLINQITLVEQKKKKRNTNFSSSSGPKTSSLESIDKYHIELVSYLTNGESHPFDLSACTDLKEDEETNHLKSYLKSYNVTASYNTCNTVLREYNNDVKLAASALLNAPFVDIGAALLPLVPDNEFKKANGGLDCASAPALLNAPFEEHGAAVQVVAKDEGKKVSGGNNRGGKENGDAVPLVGEKKLAKKSGGGVAWVSVSASLKQQLEELKSGVDEDDMNNMNTTTSTPTHNPSSNCTTNYDSHSTTSYRLSNAPLKENSDAVPLVGGKKLAKKSVVAWVSVSASQQPEELKIHEDNMITTTSTPTNNPSHYNSSNSTTNDDSHSMTSHRLIFDSYAWIDSTGSGQEHINVDVEPLVLSGGGGGEEGEEEQEEQEGKTIRFCSTDPPSTVLKLLVMLNSNDGGGNENYIEPRSVVAEMPSLLATLPTLPLPTLPLPKHFESPDATTNKEMWCCRCVVA